MLLLAVTLLFSKEQVLTLETNQDINEAIDNLKKK